MNSPFVLVHGGWCGGWVWEDVAPILRARSRIVFTPTLTGLGDRAHLADPNVDLETHIDDILEIIRTEELSNLILVGHSYAGMVIAGVADRAFDRLRHIVYLDAIVPENGESDADVVGPELVEDTRKKLRVAEKPWLIPPPVDSSRLMPHPLKTVLQPIVLRHQSETARIPHTFIHCVSEPNPMPAKPIAKSAERARARGWRMVTLNADHMAMKSAPQAISEILLAI